MTVEAHCITNHGHGSESIITPGCMQKYAACRAAHLHGTHSGRRGGVIALWDPAYPHYQSTAMSVVHWLSTASIMSGTLPVGAWPGTIKHSQPLSWHSAVPGPAVQHWAGLSCSFAGRCTDSSIMAKWVLMSLCGAVHIWYICPSRVSKGQNQPQASP
jgi:hypothetical protein